METTPDQRQYRPDSLSWLSGELRDEVPFVDGPELKAQIFDWLRDVGELPGGDVLEIVDHHLTQVRQKPDDVQGLGEFAMRRVDGGGEENFPDGCKGCEHYGTRCPVFVDPLEQDRREQLQKEYADADTSAKRRAYRRYGETVGCHQITGALADHVESYQQLQERGLDLMEATDTAIGFTGADDDAAREEARGVQGGR